MNPRKTRRKLLKQLCRPGNRICPNIEKCVNDDDHCEWYVSKLEREVYKSNKILDEFNKLPVKREAGKVANALS